MKRQMQRILFVGEPKTPKGWSSFWSMAKLSRRSRDEEKCENLLVENMLIIQVFLKDS